MTATRGRLSLLEKMQEVFNNGHPTTNLCPANYGASQEQVGDIREGKLPLSRELHGGSRLGRSLASRSATKTEVVFDYKGFFDYFVSFYFNWCEYTQVKK